jgi:hypothetical protein
MAFGHFLASFVNNAFLHDRAKPSQLSITGGPAGSVGLGVQYTF